MINGVLTLWNKLSFYLCPFTSDKTKLWGQCGFGGCFGGKYLFNYDCKLRNTSGSYGISIWACGNHLSGMTWSDQMPSRANYVMQHHHFIGPNRNSVTARSLPLVVRDCKTATSGGRNQKYSQRLGYQSVVDWSVTGIPVAPPRPLGLSHFPPRHS